jgi:hypothetical protein
LELTVEDIAELRSKDLGWGEIVIVASLASSAEKSMDDLLAMRAEGLGLGEIAKKLGIDNGLGQGVGKVLGNPDKESLDEAGAQELLSRNFELSESDITELAATGLKKQDLLMACIVAACAGESGQLQAVLSLRQEERSWEEIFETLEVEPESVNEMKNIMKREEIREKIHDTYKELKEEEKELRKQERERAKEEKHEAKNSNKDKDVSEDEDHQNNGVGRGRGKN